MKNQLMGMREKILLRKRSVIETINDELKNIFQIEHSRHRGQANFLMNLTSGIAAYCLFDKKPSIKFDMEETHEAFHQIRYGRNARTIISVLANKSLHHMAGRNAVGTSKGALALNLQL